MPERAGRWRASKIVTFSTEKGVFCVSKNRFCTIPGGNIKGMSFWSLKATVIPEGSVPAADSTRTGRIKPRLISFSWREREWNVRLHAGKNNLSYALSTLRGIPPAEAVIIPREIKEVRPQVRPVCSTEMPKTSPRRRRGSLLRKTWGDRIRNRDKTVIRGTQRRK